MMKHVLPLVVAASTMILGACAGPVGEHVTSPQYGVATRANFATQDAYNFSNERLRDLSRDFREKTQDTVTFAFNKANLDASARKALDVQAAWLRENPSVRMTILGHTDLVGSERYNNRLGLRRAKAVIAYLGRKGVSRGRLDALESRGEQEPVVQTTERERRNRRAVTSVAGFARNYVGTGLDGEYANRVYDAYQSGNFKVTEAESIEIN